MLSVSFLLFSTAVIIGTGLAVQFLRAARMPAMVGAAHGALGTAALATLVLGLLRGPNHPLPIGVSAFGPAAAVLGGVALLLGLGIFTLKHGRRRGVGLTMAAHVTLAVTAYVVFLTYLSFE